eukprot:13560187-Alexandrium_andersonii.AAC.1
MIYIVALFCIIRLSPLYYAFAAMPFGFLDLQEGRWHLLCPERHDGLRLCLLQLDELCGAGPREVLRHGDAAETPATQAKR